MKAKLNINKENHTQAYRGKSAEKKDKKKFLKVATEKDTVLKGSTIRCTAMEIMETRIQSDTSLNI